MQMYHSPEYVVGHVPVVVVHPPSGRVGEDDRSLGDVERVVHCGGGYVGEVDQHSEAVHLADDLSAEVREAIVANVEIAGVDRRRVSPVTIFIGYEVEH